MKGYAMARRLNVLVTGASSGIGRATATEFARQGHLVFAAARREEVLAGLAAAAPNIQAVGLDVTDEGSVNRAWAKIDAATGGAGVDVLVNCAGFALTGPVEILAGPAVQRQFATNIGEAADANADAGAGQEIPPAYADMAARGSRYLAAQIAKGIAADQVAATIVKAATQPSPRLRYVVPNSARPLIALLTSLPGKLADRAKQRALAAT